MYAKIKYKIIPFVVLSKAEGSMPLVVSKRRAAAGWSVWKVGTGVATCILPPTWWCQWWMLMLFWLHNCCCCCRDMSSTCGDCKWCGTEGCCEKKSTAALLELSAVLGKDDAVSTVSNLMLWLSFSFFIEWFDFGAPLEWEFWDDEFSLRLRCWIVSFFMLIGRGT